MHGNYFPREPLHGRTPARNQPLPRRLRTARGLCPHRRLILSGLRQTGKTLTVRESGVRSYSNVVYLDVRANTAVHAVFEGSLDVDQMVLSITATDSDARFVPNQTLLVLDEIQGCPNARSSRKVVGLVMRAPGVSHVSEGPEHLTETAGRVVLCLQFRSHNGRFPGLYVGNCRQSCLVPAPTSASAPGVALIMSSLSGRV